MRLRFPEEEKRLPWLSMLLEAYAIIDSGIEAAVRTQTEMVGKKPLACRMGCAACCRTHKDIPVYPHELAGIYWYSAEKLPADKKGGLKKRLASHSPACPFLDAGACVIHAVRPAACRQFNVMGLACAEGEDAFFTRRADVITPIREYTERAFMGVLSFYSLGMAADKRHAANLIIRKQVVNLKEHKWDGLAGLL